MTKLRARITLGDGEGVLSADTVAEFAAGVEQTLSAFANLGTPEAASLGKSLVGRLTDERVVWNVSMANEAILTFRDALFRESAKHGWAKIDEHYAGYFAKTDDVSDDPRPWGGPVYERFVHARKDIAAAGCAIAVDLPTAAVFHLVRASEHGLRWLARRLKVKISDKGRRIPLEYGAWNKVLDGVKGRLTRAHSLPTNARRDAQLDVYSRAADHCEYMRDIWRNNVSHGKSYNVEEAVAALSRVREFMQFLAGIK